MPSFPKGAFPVVGILGGGQLARMTAFAAMRMGFDVRFLLPEASGPVRGLGQSFVGDWTDAGVLRDFGSVCEVVTAESEWAPVKEAEAALQGRVPVRPASFTLGIVRHKGRQKTWLRDAGLPVPRFACCATLEEATETANHFGYPVLAKRYTHAYDGYGNATVHSADELRAAWERLAAEDGLLIEAFVSFRRELSVLVARRPGGEHVIYPVADTEQRNHRCYAVEVPSCIEDAEADEARRIGLAAVEAVQGTGLVAVELFHTEDGDILINELAPRPHNTGHYSIEGSYTSQFENHVRAVLDIPLGNPELRTPVAIMVNVFGSRDGTASPAGLNEALTVPGVAVHVYGKPNVRMHRKMGHVTVTGNDRIAARRLAETAAAHLRL
ncbi:MAG: 5-(carboxyamino)imidazole ribonucleotide synthase [Bacteroidetes bacterium SB0662_bin_6]|nr:5-(carboxyamino)imidazole ribonucleotide synthase [Bacteroidetes bacterium SB0668_bin_1]MYE04983.1 5-(carboxyamino)imidazole ribonucleotide synthase [Bacteroidetes bacterium SB0662_bin_6]